MFIPSVILSPIEVQSFDFPIGTWAVQPTTGDKPPSLGGHTLTIIDNKRAVLFGGSRNGRPQNATYILDVEKWEWREMKIDGLPPARYHHAICVLESTVPGQSSQLMVIGGWNGNNGLSDVWLFDVDDTSWSKVPLPTEMTGRWGHSAVAFGAGSDFRVIVLFGGICRRAIAKTTFLLLAQQEGSWVIDSAVGLEQHDVLKEQLERVLSTHHHYDSKFPGVCFLGEPQKVTVQPRKRVTTSPLGLATTLEIPSDAIETEPDTPANITLGPCLPTPSFIYPEGYTPFSAVYHVSADSPFKKDVQLKFEHFAKVEKDKEQQQEVMVFRAKSSPAVTDGKMEFLLSPVVDTEFNVGEGHCRVAIQDPGFVSAGILQSSKIQRRYAVMCSYSNLVEGVQHAAVAIVLDDEVYMKNFREALQQEWGSGMSLSHRSKVNATFVGPNALVEFPKSLRGWNVTPDSDPCTILQEDVDFYKSSCLSLYDYPPRIFFDVIPTKNAEPCTLQLRVSGLSRDVNFHISLRNAIITKGKDKAHL